MLASRKWITRERFKRGWNQRLLAHHIALGLKERFICRVERGIIADNDLSERLIERLARVFNQTREWVLKGGLEDASESSQKGKGPS